MKLLNLLLFVMLIYILHSLVCVFGEKMSKSTTIKPKSSSVKTVKPKDKKSNHLSTLVPRSQLKNSKSDKFLTSTTIKPNVKKSKEKKKTNNKRVEKSNSKDSKTKLKDVTTMRPKDEYTEDDFFFNGKGDVLASKKQVTKKSENHLKASGRGLVQRKLIRDRDVRSGKPPKKTNNSKKNPKINYNNGEDRMAHKGNEKDGSSSKNKFEIRFKAMGDLDNATELNHDEYLKLAAGHYHGLDKYPVGTDSIVNIISDGKCTLQIGCPEVHLRKNCESDYLLIKAQNSMLTICGDKNENFYYRAPTPKSFLSIRLKIDPSSIIRVTEFHRGILCIVQCILPCSHSLSNSTGGGGGGGNGESENSDGDGKENGEGSGSNSTPNPGDGDPDYQIIMPPHPDGSKDKCGGPDEDHDGYGDKCDNCPDLFNDDQSDIDGDNIGDICDTCPTEPNPEQEFVCLYPETPDVDDNHHNDDDDKDGVGNNDGKDVKDENPDGNNSESSNNDGGTGNIGEIDSCSASDLDECDTCPLPPSTEEEFICKSPEVEPISDMDEGKEEAPKICTGSDVDQDGIPDMCDNCPKTKNKDQLDSDKDGLGDECDNCPDLYNPNQEFYCIFPSLFEFNHG